jgi:hypothetical protein
VCVWVQVGLYVLYVCFAVNVLTAQVRNTADKAMGQRASGGSSVRAGLHVAIHAEVLHRALLRDDPPVFRNKLLRARERDARARTSAHARGARTEAKRNIRGQPPETARTRTMAHGTNGHRLRSTLIAAVPPHRAAAPSCSGKVSGKRDRSQSRELGTNGIGSIGADRERDCCSHRRSS